MMQFYAFSRALCFVFPLSTTIVMLNSCIKRFKITEEFIKNNNNNRILIGCITIGKTILTDGCLHKDNKRQATLLGRTIKRVENTVGKGEQFLFFPVF